MQAHQPPPDPLGGDAHEPGSWAARLAERFDAVVFDVGNTLIASAPLGTAVADLVAVALPGARVALDAVRAAMRVAIVTNTSVMGEASVRGHLRAAGLGDEFEVVIATAELGVHKPDPAPLLEAAARLALPASRCLYVGDLESDRVAATAAGMAFCWTGPDIAVALARFEQAAST